jgi:hypothetical protein
VRLNPVAAGLIEGFAARDVTVDFAGLQREERDAGAAQIASAV